MTRPTAPRSAIPPRRKRSKTPLFIALAILGLIVVFALIRLTINSFERRAAHRMVNPVPATPAELDAGKNLYQTHCASCHGSDGDGQGDRAGELWSKPTDFRKAAKMRRSTDGDLFWITTKGSWPMPAFEKKLTPLERWQAIDYIRTFAQPSTSSK
ncbi:MAG TPA: cytochrome c [Candidatus Aquilonibacter sp.]|nr:cytochrome c [Candidatus Aquilonibacter sp.]